MKESRTTVGNITSALHLLHRAGQCADELFTIHLGQSDLTPRQFAVLAAVSNSDEPSQTTLVEMTGIDRSTLAEIVRRLVSRGLLARRRTRQDARMYAVRLTADGQAVLKKAEPAAKATDTRLLSAIPQGERQVFIQALNRIVRTISSSSEAR